MAHLASSITLLRNPQVLLQQLSEIHDHLEP